jgi:hypothetical protein
MSSTGMILLATLTVFAPRLSAAPQAGMDADGKPVTVSVEIEGSVPGFTQDQLSAYVSAQMTAAEVGSFQFAPANAAGNVEPANRVVWRFKMLPYAGGSVRYIGPAISKLREGFGMERAVGIDAKIYLNGKYQASTFDQASIKGGAADPNLTSAIKKVTKMIVSNALTETTSNTIKVASRLDVKTG